MAASPAKYAELFDQKVEAELNSGCHLWSGAVTSWGYGNVTVEGRQYRAHRISFERYRGPIPPGLVVRHKCDTPACVNPAHLELGTEADNAADKGRRGRVPTKLSADDVRQVRAATGTCREIGDRFGVSASAVCLIKSHSRRKYVEA